MSASRNSPEIVEVLLKAGAKVNEKNNVNEINILRNIHTQTPLSLCLMSYHKAHFITFHFLSDQAHGDFPI